MNADDFRVLGAAGAKLDQITKGSEGPAGSFSIDQIKAALANPQEAGLTEDEVAVLKAFNGDANAQILLDAADGKSDMMFDYRLSPNFKNVVALSMEIRNAISAHAAALDASGDNSLTPEEITSALDKGALELSPDHEISLTALQWSVDPAKSRKTEPFFGVMDSADGKTDGRISLANLKNLSSFAAEFRDAAPTAASGFTAARSAAAGVLLDDNQELDIAFKGHKPNVLGIGDGMISWNDIQSRIQTLAADDPLKVRLEGIDRATYDALRGKNKYVMVDDLKAMLSDPATADAKKMLRANDMDNPGYSVAGVIGDRANDAEGASVGLAVTAASGDKGVWQYSTDQGKSWNDLQTAGEQDSLLLGPTDRLRFQPDGSSPTEAALTYRAWDQTSGKAGERADTRLNGGSSAFSTDTGNLVVKVLPANTAPSMPGEGVEPSPGAGGAGGAATPPLENPPASLTPPQPPAATLPPPAATLPPPAATLTSAAAEDVRLGLAVARSALLPYRNYFDGIAKQTQGPAHVPGVVNQDVLRRAAAMNQLPKTASDALGEFLASPTAYTTLQNAVLAPRYTNGEQKANGLYLGVFQKWIEDKAQLSRVDVAVDEQADLFDKSAANATRDSSAVGDRLTRVQDVVTVLLRHRDALGTDLLTAADVANYLNNHRSELSADEQAALSYFSQQDFVWLMEQGTSAEGSRHPEVARANGKLSVPWLEQWLATNDKGATMRREQYVELAGEPKPSEIDRTYDGFSVLDL